MKIHNLCDSNSDFYDEDTHSVYEYFYVDDYHCLHRLDGPVFKKLDTGFIGYYIDGIDFNEKDYYNHPEVLKYKYLQQHPEMEAFT